MNSRRFAFVCLCLISAGCSSKAPAPQFPQPAATRPALLRQDTFVATVEPLQLKDVADSVFRDFGLNVAGGGMFSEQTGGDFFMSRAAATTFSKQKIVAEARWEGQGRTSVLFQSDLPAAQHDLILNRLRDRLTRSTTQPVGRSSGASPKMSS